MVRGFCKMDMVGDGYKVYDEMKCEPNLVTCNTIVHGLCKKGLMENAHCIIEWIIESKRYLPDTKYTLLWYSKDFPFKSSFYFLYEGLHHFMLLSCI